MRKVKKVCCRAGVISSSKFTHAMIAVWKVQPASYDTGYFMRIRFAVLFKESINRNFAVYQEHKRL